METINRLVGDALDSQKFVEQIKRDFAAMEDTTHVLPERYGNETRADRRARERAEKKQAWRKLKSSV